MGHTLWLEISDGATQTGGNPDDNSMMLRLSDELDDLAVRLGLSPLSTFHDYSVVARAYASELGELEAAAVSQPEQWHDAALGLAAVEGLLRELGARPESLASSSEREALLRDLNHCRVRLEEATSRDLRFRLLVVP